LVDAGSGILSGHAIDLDTRVAALVGVGEHQLGDRAPFADDLDDLSRGDSQTVAVGRIDPGKAPTNVFTASFRHL
jgi:hypothetical protein